ncbi:hypothetical protein GCM10011395_16590 [Sphingomonas psychrolutea]|uniref:Type II toxin-antitoxin system RelE/ParE family toxin n=1 Tax=Sphingomonas psychrolutea TaxID=1259676 RepID=A0ABQ1GPC2_9SPHN|nr:hypothetical protein GCM10011395_16590 [Sphingomonas psychrolutea]
MGTKPEVTRRLLVSESAEEDLRSISRYIATESDRATADAVRTGIVTHCRRLADLPGTLGTERAELSPGLRSTPHKSYVIYFRYSGDRVEIVNVLDARRDVAAHFSPQDDDG